MIKKISAVLVIFNKLPDRKNISKILESGISNLLVINNNPDYKSSDFLFLNDIRNTSFIDNKNINGLAGAYNKAIKFYKDNKIECSHILFLDDDSNFESLKLFLESNLTQEILSSDKEAVIGPRYIESATGIYGKCVKLTRLCFKVTSPTNPDLIKVSFIINSFSIWPKETILKIGNYDEKLKIDHVDTDYCMRANQLGIPIFINNAVTFEHTIGNRVAYNFLGFKLQSSGHNIERKSLIIKNTRILMFRYGLKNPGFFALCVVRLIYEFVSVMIAEESKFKKISFMFKALIYK